MNSLIDIPENITVNIKIDPQTAMTLAGAIFLAIVMAMLAGVLLKKL